MPPSPSFQRSPRILPDLPHGEVKIPQPDPPPTPVATSAIQILLPAIFAVVSLVVTLGLMGSSGSSSGPLIVLSFGFMLVNSIVALSGYVSQKGSYKRALGERSQKYVALLQSIRQDLQGRYDQQQNALLHIDPDPDECLARVHRLDRRLWERSPLNDDFLSVRLGLGQRPFAVTIKAPEQSSAMTGDPLTTAAQQLAADFSVVKDVPVCLPLGKAGVAGLAGGRDPILSAARSLAMQIATHHSPDEVKLVALFPQSEMKHWSWLRWLPHAWADGRHRLLACDKDTAQRLLNGLYDLLSRRALQAGDAKDGKKEYLPYFVFVVADQSLVEKHPIIPLLLSKGREISARTLFLAGRLEDLPQACQGIAEIRPDAGNLILAGGSAQAAFKPDLVEADPVHDHADDLARTLAPIHIQSVAPAADIPDSVTFLDFLGVSAVEDVNVLEQWKKSEPFKTLSVPIGKRMGNETLFLDLHEKGHGPHGLVAGMTRSGKTAFMSSFIGLCALSFHPHEVAFVAIDYKGGDLIREIAELPHLIDTITNLEGNSMTRALQALRSEMRRRQVIFNQAGVGNINDYLRRHREGKAPIPLPRIIIISDEFAELVQQQPDFIRELVSIARVGGSLGVHLILATQQPSGVVNDQIWGNTRFRICFKFARTEDSKAVLKRADAASITQQGRGYFQVGENEIFELFQAPWGEAPYTPGAAISGDPHDIVEVALDGSRQSLTGSKQQATTGPSCVSQLCALSEYIKATAERAGFARLPGPLLRPLPEKIALPDVRRPDGWTGHSWVPASGWLKPVIGVVDNPSQQWQGPLSIDLGKEGHLAVYGAPGTGKTTFLQTLVTSLAQSHTPADVNMYLMDFGSRLLTQFAGLPHVGGVVTATDGEKLVRLLRFCARQIDERQHTFAQAGVKTLIEYRKRAASPMTAIVLILDNYTDFAKSYPDWVEPLADIAREGGNYGVHLVLTAAGPEISGFMRVRDSVTMAVALQLANPSDYSTAVGRTEGLVPAKAAGRGLVKGPPVLEFQTALPVAGDSEPLRTQALKDMIERMSRAWTGDRARPIPMLPDVVPLSQILAAGTTWAPAPSDGSLAVPLGMDVDTLEQVSVDTADGPHFMISGTLQSGKTTFLQTWLLALAERYSPQCLQIYLVDFRHSGLFALQGLPHNGLQGLPPGQRVIEDGDRLGQTINDIAVQLRERRHALNAARQADDTINEKAFIARYPAIVLAIDDCDALKGDQALSAGIKDSLDALVRRQRGLGLHVVVAGPSRDLAYPMDNWVKAISEMQTGVAFGSGPDELQLLNIKGLPFGESGSSLPPGQGYLGRRGRFVRFKAASCQASTCTPRMARWIAQIAQRAEQPTG